MEKPKCNLCDYSLKLVTQLGILKNRAYWICENDKCKNFYKEVDVVKETRKLQRLEEKKIELFRQQKLFN